MIVWPIIQRELGVWARNRGTYWGRFAVALCGMVVCLWQFGMMSWLSSSPSTVGRNVFDGLVVAAFLLGCCGCFLTADTISVERRGATLPLLLLTRLKPFGIVLAKLGSSGFACLCSVVALAPLLMLPVLAGGVTGGEVLRKGLACLNALFFALAVGLYQSARAQEKFKAGALAGTTLAAFLFLPLTAELVGVSLPSFVSPLNCVISASDGNFRAQPSRYWISIFTVQILAWLLLKSASAKLKQPDEDAQRSGVTSAGVAFAQAFPRKTVRYDNPVAWLFPRQRGIRATVWVAAITVLVYHTFWILLYHFPFFSGFAWSGLIIQLPWLVCSSISGSLFAWASSRFTFEARRNGELELLLTTPVGVETFVSGQWTALKKLLRVPVVVMLLPLFLEALTSVLGRPGSGLLVLLGVVNVMVGTGALCWAGMWFGFIARRQSGAILLTIGLVEGVPFLISTLAMVLFSIFSSNGFWGIFPMPWILLHVLTLLFYLRVIREAKRRLLREVSRTGPSNFSLSHSLASANKGMLQQL